MWPASDDVTDAEAGRCPRPLGGITTPDSSQHGSHLVPLSRTSLVEDCAVLVDVEIGRSTGVDDYSSSASIWSVLCAPDE